MHHREMLSSEEQSQALALAFRPEAEFSFYHTAYSRLGDLAASLANILAS